MSGSEQQGFEAGGSSSSRCSPQLLTPDYQPPSPDETEVIPIAAMCQSCICNTALRPNSPNQHPPISGSPLKTVHSCSNASTSKGPEKSGCGFVSNAENQTSWEELICSQCLVRFNSAQTPAVIAKKAIDFEAKLTDLRVHVTSGRRASCSALPGIKESKVEEETEEELEFEEKSLIKLRMTQDRSRSFSLAKSNEGLSHCFTTVYENVDIKDKSNNEELSLSEDPSNQQNTSLLSPSNSDMSSCGSLSSRVHSSRTWPQSAIRSASAIHESVLEDCDSSGTYCGESLSQIPQISVSQEDVGSLASESDLAVNLN